MERLHLLMQAYWDHEPNIDRTAGGPHPQQLRRVGGVWTFQDLPAGQPLRARRARGPIVDAPFMGSLQDAKAPERLKSRGLERFFSPQAPVGRWEGLDGRKMDGRKMKTAGRSHSIFLPFIFLPSNSGSR